RPVDTRSKDCWRASRRAARPGTRSRAMSHRDSPSRSSYTVCERQRDTSMSDPTDGAETIAPEIQQYLIRIRLREPLLPEDYLTTEAGLRVGEFVVVESGTATVLGEVRRPARRLPEFKRDRLYRRVVRRATEAEAAEWRERREREVRGVATCLRLARARGL